MKCQIVNTPCLHPSCPRNLRKTEKKVTFVQRHFAPRAAGMALVSAKPPKIKNKQEIVAGFCVKNQGERTCSEECFRVLTISCRRTSPNLSQKTEQFGTEGIRFKRFLKKNSVPSVYPVPSKAQLEAWSR